MSQTVQRNVGTCNAWSAQTNQYGGINSHNETNPHRGVHPQGRQLQRRCNHTSRMARNVVYLKQQELEQGRVAYGYDVHREILEVRYGW